MNNRLLIFSFLFLICCGSRGGAEESELLLKKKLLQEHVLRQTQELIFETLDHQLRLLRENNLDLLPYTRDLEQLRRTLIDLSDQKMTYVISVLSQNQQFAEASQREILQQVRSEIHFITESLIYERKRLVNNLQILQIRERTNELIRKQLDARTVVKELADATSIDQEADIIDLLQDQRDIELLYFQLLDSLNGLAESSESPSSIAQRGISLFQSASLEEELENIINGIENESFSASIDSQTIIIKVLQNLAEILGQTTVKPSQGFIEQAKAIQELTVKQTNLYKKTSNTELNAASSDVLISEQAMISNRLKQLVLEIENQPKIVNYLRLAESASERTRLGLFELAKEKSLSEQKDILKSLSQAKKILLELAASHSIETQGKSIAENISRLEQAQENLKKLARQQRKVSQSARERPQAAQTLQNEVKEDLEKMAEETDFSEQAKARLEDAARAAEKSVKALQETGDENADTRRQAADHVQESIEKVQDQIDASLSSARQQQRNAQENAANNLQEPQAQVVGRKKNQQNSSTVSGTGESKRSGDSRTGFSSADSHAKSRLLQNESWFAKLPPKIRQSILTKSRQPAPRVYRQRLKQYFESLD